MVLIPAMVAFGIPPINAITINKFQNLLGALQPFATMAPKALQTLLISNDCCQRPLLAQSWGDWSGYIGSVTGVLTAILPYVLLAVAFYSILPDRFISWWLAGVPPIECVWGMSAVWALLGLYGGSVSLGTGPILIAAHRLVHNSELNSAITMTKPIMLAINMTSMSVLILMGHLCGKLHYCLPSGMSLAMAGARMVTWSLDWLARIIVFVVPVILAFKLMGCVAFLDA